MKNFKSKVVKTKKAFSTLIIVILLCIVGVFLVAGSRDKSKAYVDGVFTDLDTKSDNLWDTTTTP